MNTTTTTTTTEGRHMPDCWRNFHDALRAGSDRVLLYGVPGTGKTTAGIKYGTNNRNAYRLTCTSDMTDERLTGFWKRVKDGYAYHEGLGILAWREGARLVVDEIDKASGDVLGTLLNLLDSPESAQWRNDDTGEILTPSVGFSAVATTNVEDLRDLPEALLDRFPIAIRIDTPHPDALDRLPENLRHMASQLCDRPEGERASLRAFLEFARISPVLGIESSARMVFRNMADEIIEALLVAQVTQ